MTIQTKPILMSAPMVLALLREIESPGTGKTQTRRGLKLKKYGTVLDFGKSDTDGYDWHFRDKEMRWHDFRHDDLVNLCPYGKPGDLLYVKETWSHTGTGVWTTQDALKALDGHVEYRASNDIAGAGWFPSIFMFRKFSRLTLEITDIRVERLQDISEEDAKAEGVLRDSDGWRDYMMPCTQCCATAYDSYKTLWTSINGPESWTANPWVWVVSFRPHLINVDQFIKARAA